MLLNAVERHDDDETMYYACYACYALANMADSGK